MDDLFLLTTSDTVAAFMASVQRWLDSIEQWSATRGLGLDKPSFVFATCRTPTSGEADHALSAENFVEGNPLPTPQASLLPAPSPLTDTDSITTQPALPAPSPPPERPVPPAPSRHPVLALRLPGGDLLPPPSSSLRILGMDLGAMLNTN